MADSELLDTIASAMLKQCRDFRTARRMISAVESNVQGEAQKKLIEKLKRRLAQFETPKENERGR